MLDIIFLSKNTESYNTSLLNAVLPFIGSIIGSSIVLVIGYIKLKSQNDYWKNEINLSIKKLQSEETRWELEHRLRKRDEIFFNLYENIMEYLGCIKAVNVEKLKEQLIKLREKIDLLQSVETDFYPNHKNIFINNSDKLIDLLNLSSIYFPEESPELQKLNESKEVILLIDHLITYFRGGLIDEDYKTQYVNGKNHNEIYNSLEEKVLEVHKLLFEVFKILQEKIAIGIRNKDNSEI